MVDHMGRGSGERQAGSERAGFAEEVARELQGTVTGRLGGELTPGERLARRRPLPSSGSSQDRIYTAPNRDYPDDTDLCFERGNGTVVVRLTPGDLPKLFAAAGGLAPGLEELKATAQELARNGLPEEHGKGLANTAEAVTGLVFEAHVVGYRLCDEDYRVTGEGRQQVRDFLIGLKEDGTDRGHLDAKALERVIDMLAES